LHALRRAARCSDEIASLEAQVDLDGPTAVGSRGQVRVHPALSALVALRTLESRLLASIDLADPALVVESPARRRGRRAAERRYVQQADARRRVRAV
jgi:hypothetical protein